MHEIPVTVLIAARNEERNIAEAVASVRWAQKIYVLDSHSTDRTAELARDGGADVVQFSYEGGWPKKRNWALENLLITTEWVLVLDADERVTPKLAAEIASAVQREDRDGFYIRWKFIFLGRWMQYSWRHGWMLRLFRRGRAAYEDLGMRAEGGWDTEVHENIVCNGDCGRLSEMLLHESRQNLSFWIAKQNEFSTWNARRRLQQLEQPMPPLAGLWSGDPVQVRKWMKALYLRLPGKPVLMFTWLYLVRAGFLDGKAGFIFCCLRAMHEFNIQAKIYEQRMAVR